MMRKSSQSSLEYAVVIAVVALALIAARAYIRRGMEGRLRQAADELGQPYDPRHTTADISIAHAGRTTTTIQTSEVNIEDPADPTKTIKKDRTTTTTNIEWENEWRHGDETVDNLP